jgi:DNA-binding IclR family transcriptional regulator
MSGLDRYLRLLRFFSEQKSTWTVQELSDAMMVPPSSVYRAVHDLIAAGLLEPSREANYRLGPAFLEFDRLIRHTDPLVRHGSAFLPDIAGQSHVPCVVVLARLYGDQVMCVADALSAGTQFRTSYERGRPMPLTLGATSKTILSQLPTRRLKKLLAGASSVATSPDFRDELLAARRHGYCITRGEVDPGLVGLAVPISFPELSITASLSLIIEAGKHDEAVERRLMMLLVSSAGLLQAVLAKDLG